MSAQHTPGPWTISTDTKSQHGLAWGGYWQIDGEYDAVACNQYCYANTKPEVSAANARLIAAAPELLEALEALMPSNVSLTNRNIRDMHTLPMDVEVGALRRAAAAIAKARGEA